MLSSVSASTSLILTKVYVLLPVRYDALLTELKKGKRLHCWPIMCKPLLICLGLASFKQEHIGIGLQFTKYYEDLIQAVPQLLYSA